jgi:hypothetical protein
LCSERREDESLVNIEDREHVVKVSARDVDALREWLKWPSGSLRLGRRCSINAVEGGGILVRTDPFRYEKGDR